MRIDEESLSSFLSHLISSYIFILILFCLSPIVANPNKIQIWNRKYQKINYGFRKIEKIVEVKEPFSVNDIFTFKLRKS